MYPEAKRIDYLKPLGADEMDASAPLDSSDPSDPSGGVFSDGIGSNPSLDIKLKVDTAPRKRHMALSRYGRQQILRAGSCFSMSGDTERLLLTGTLPGSTCKAFRALAENSTIATKTLTNWLTKHEPGCKWQYVWEFQGRGALHLHLVCEVGKVPGEYIRSHFKDEWNRILSTIGALSDTDLRAKTATYSHPAAKTQADVTVCDREPSRYISKYISKKSTNANGFNRFPPKQWFQVSRALLRELRARTKTYEIEGLSHRQALAFIEEATHNLSSCALAGWRRFQGSVLAWSGHGYQDSFQITDWSDRFMEATKTLSPTIIIAKHALTTSKNYPQIRCWLRGCPTGRIEEAMRFGEVSETEMLMLIESVMEAIATSWTTLNRKYSAAMFMSRSICWWKAKYGYSKWTPEFVDEINKICEAGLTAESVRTKVSSNRF